MQFDGSFQMKRIFYYTIPLKFNNAPLLDFLKAEG